MKTKLIAISICMLLLAATYPVFGMELNTEVKSRGDRNQENNYMADGIVHNNDFNPSYFPQGSWLGVDQEQTDSSGWGWAITPQYWCAQSFKPTNEQLIGVELLIYPFNDPPADLEITVSIRDSLSGNDLSIATVDADQVKDIGSWLLFDFPDITVTPDNTYYIVCHCNGGVYPDNYEWLFGLNNSYGRGEAWCSSNSGSSWIKLWQWYDYDPDFTEPDFCFKTFYSKKKNMLESAPLLRFMENHLHIFPIIRFLLGL